jgi:hypothetical protein
MGKSLKSKSTESYELYSNLLMNHDFTTKEKARIKSREGKIRIIKRGAKLRSSGKISVVFFNNRPPVFKAAEVWRIDEKEPCGNFFISPGKLRIS